MDTLSEEVRRIVQDEISRAQSEILQMVRDEVIRVATRPDAKYLSLQDAAKHCGIATQTLRNMRHRGEGPRAYKHGRLVVFARSELDAWLESRLVREG